MRDQIEQAHIEGYKSTSGAQKHGRWILVFLLLFFAVPLVIVMLLHHYNWHPTGKSYGEFIRPVRKIQLPQALLDVNGKSISVEVFHDKWSMVYIADDCWEVCEDRLHSMRQLHVSLAKDSNRIQRVFISASAKTPELQKQYPDLVIISQPATGVANLSQQFDIAGMAANSDSRIYLVDPLGNLMMSYPASIADAAIRKDIERLLKYSWAG